MKFKRLIIMVTGAALVTTALLTGCSSSGSVSSTAAGTSGTSAQAADTSTELTAYTQTDIDTGDMFTDRDLDAGYEASEAKTITLADGASTSDSDAVTVSGNTVTITAEGVYVVSGTLTNGQIVVSCADTEKVQIVLDGANITCASGAAISVTQADKVFLTLADGSENSVASTGEFSTDSNVDGAIFSKSDLTLNGSGSLTVTCESGHGIVSKDDLAVTGGTYTITAGKTGLSGKDSVRIADGTFTIASGTDGIHSENTDDTTKGFVYIAAGTFNITSGTDGISAQSALQIDGGTFTITTGGGSANASTKSDGTANGSWGNWGAKGMSTDTAAGDSSAVTVSAATTDTTAAETVAQQSTTTSETSSAKGLKCAGDLVVNNGTFTIDSSDDAVHSNTNVTIAGGTFDISSGDDGIHADTQTSITGGTVNISKSYEGIEGQSILISGGDITVVSSDDGLNAAGGNDSSSLNRQGANDFTADADCYIEISGGTLYVNASGDGIDSNGSLAISGGTVTVSGPTNDGNGTFDYNGTAVITGGTVMGAGSSGMAQTFTDGSTQGSILYALSGTQQAGTEVTLKDSSGNVIASFTADKQFSSVQFSGPQITSDGTYTITVGGTDYTVQMGGTLIYSNSTGSGMGGGQTQGGRGKMG